MPRTTQTTFDARKSINAGFLKKNRPPHAGKGRRKGIPNVVTQSTREMFCAFVHNNIGGAQDLYNRVAKTDPAKALVILANLADFCLPRLARTETIVSGTPLVSPTPISDPAEAASAYAAILGNSTIDLALVRFSPVPHQDKVVAEQTPAPSNNVVELHR